MTVSPHDQARILSEALPHMQRYDEEIVVIKYGGHAMGEEQTARDFAKDVVLLEQTAINPVVVHGGGPQIETMLKRLGIKSAFAAGLRVTDAATMEIVEMVLAGSINKQIVGYINGAGGKAIGLSGKDGNMVVARKVNRQVIDPQSQREEEVDLGFVGEPEKVDVTVLNQILGQRRQLQCQRRHLRRLHRRRAEGQAAAAAHRRARRARQIEVADRGIVGRRSAPADRRRHHRRRDDPQGRDLHQRARSGGRGGGHPRRQGAACGAAGTVHRPRRRHADPPLIRPRHCQRLLA
jgi:hypothetical protein